MTHSILVTGDRGYIGSLLVPMLVERGHEVRGIDQRYYDHSAFLRVAPSAPSVQKDIRDLERADLDGVDTVIHLAALSNDPLGDIDANLTYDINYHASVRLAELARDAGVKRFVMSSSCSAYGRAGEAMIDETAALNPVTPYGRSKVMAEQDVARMADDAFSPVFLRHATAYGLSPMLRFDLVVNNLVAYAVARGDVFLKSDGQAWRPLVHVEDICRGLVAAALADRSAVHNGVFNIGRTADNFRIVDVAGMVADLVDCPTVRFCENACRDTRTYRVDFSRAEQSLPGFDPAWSVPEGVLDLHRAVRSRGLTVAEFEGARFSRVATIRDMMDRGQLDAGLRWRAEQNVA